MKSFRDFYIFCSASISSWYIFHSSFNHISATFEKKRDELISSHFMRKGLFFKKGIFFLTLYSFWVNCLFSFLGKLTKQFDSALNLLLAHVIKVGFTQFPDILTSGSEGVRQGKERKGKGRKGRGRCEACVWVWWFDIFIIFFCCLNIYLNYFQVIGSVSVLSGQC